MLLRQSQKISSIRTSLRQNLNRIVLPFNQRASCRNCLWLINLAPENWNWKCFWLKKDIGSESSGPRAAHSYPAFSRWCHGCDTLCASEGTEKTWSTQQKVLDKEYDSRSYKEEKTLSKQVSIPIFSLCPQPVTRKAWQCRHFPAQGALKGQTAKGFSHSTLVYILLPGSTAY